MKRITWDGVGIAALAAFVLLFVGGVCWAFVKDVQHDTARMNAEAAAYGCRPGAFTFCYERGK